ncbi:MAG TPA: chorismate mutase [Actinomycetota bacterium]|jgi:chorismate mutase|nr:chorismate mutase [Actinomycetota bacterium]
MEQQRWACRGIRGAITTAGNGAAAIEEATKELLDGLIEANDCRLEDVAAAIFTIPDELAGANPPAAARKHGWSRVPLLAVREQEAVGLVDDCLRVLVLWNTTCSQDQIRHVYLRGATVLRPDLSNGSALGAKA